MIKSELIEKLAAENTHLTHAEVERVVNVSTQFDHARSFALQATELIDRAGLTAAEWGRVPVVVNLPSFAPGVAAVLAELHGRTGGLWKPPVSCLGTFYSRQASAILAREKATPRWSSRRRK